MALEKDDWYAIEDLAIYLKDKNKKIFIVNNFPEFYVYQSRKGNVIDSYVQRNFFSIQSIENIREKLERMAYENIYPSVFKIKKNVTAFANKTNIKIFDPFDFMLI